MSPTRILRRERLVALASAAVLSFMVFMLAEIHLIPKVSGLLVSDAKAAANAFANGADETLQFQRGSGSALAEKKSAQQKTIVHDMTIANDGLVLLRGARVVSMSESIMTVAVNYGATAFTWILDTGPDTKYPLTDGSYGSFDSVQVGDDIIATGKLIGTGSEPRIEAQFIREE